MTKIDLNTSPYFDDYNESKKFYKILFRPGRALQARELTQIQSIIQNQIGRFGRHFFKKLALVSPRPSLGCKYDPSTVFVKIPVSSESRTQTESNLNNYWVNKKIKSQNNVEGLVIGYHKTDSFVRLFISLETAGTGTDGTLANNFQKGDTVSVNVVDTLPGGQQNITTTLTAKIESTTNAVGRIASVEIPDSIYFYEDYFVLVDTQWLFITPEDVENDLAWNAMPTCEVGIEMIESVVTFEEDESLLDNASGTSNYSAAGADRLKIEGKLVVKSINATDQNFIRLLTISKGIITKAWQLETDPYQDPYKAILAKRTYDESGNYTVKPFMVETRPFLGTDNKGLFTEELLSVPYDVDSEGVPDELSVILAKEKAIEIAKNVFELNWESTDEAKIFARNQRYYPGTSYDATNDAESFVKLCDDRLGLRFQPGSAYVEGYYQEKPVITQVSIRKSRTSDFLQNKTVRAPKGTYFLIDSVSGMPPIADVGNSNLSYDQVELHSRVLSGSTDVPAVTTKIGTARVYSIELYSGTTGTANASYALGVFDVKFDSGFDATDIASIYYGRVGSSSATGTFSANMVFKDVTTNPSLKFTGTISKYTPKTVSGAATFAGAVITLDYNADGTTRDADFIQHYTVGTILSITDSVTSGGTTQDVTVERTITSVSKSDVSNEFFIAIGLNEALPDTFVSPLKVVKTVRKVKGLGTLWKTNLGEKLEKGDQVTIGTGDKKKIYTVYSNPSNDNELSLDPDPTDSSNPNAAPWDDNATITYLVSESLQDSSEGNAGLVYRLPHTEIRAIRGGVKNSPNYASLTTTYVATRYLVTGTNAGPTVSATGVQYALNDQSLDFERGISNYGLIDLSTGQWFQLFRKGTGNEGNIATGTYTAEVDFVDRQILFNFSGGVGKTFGVIVAVEKSLNTATPDTKTLVKGSFSGTPSKRTGGGVKEISTTDNKKISLDVPDVLRITRIVESPNIQTDPSDLEVLPNGHQDISFKYDLDNGQRDYYYGIANVELRPGFDKPKGKLRIEFDYFTHNGTGDYFSVDSYPWNSNTSPNSVPQMTYDEIPEYFSTKFGKYDLKACLDFRPVCRTGSNATQDGKYAFVRYKDLPIDTVTCSYHVYEERRDKIFIDKDGNIKVKYGVPGIIADIPADPVDGMVLYDVEMMPYTEDHRKCILKMRDNRRYTMRDIGKLEKRVKNLEYYTTLSLLEKDTKDLIIKDSLGQDKFKHGFLVDNFANESVSAISHPDFTAALDKVLGELKPRVFDNHIKVVERWLMPNQLSTLPALPTVAAAREAFNYEQTGGLYTLAYSNVSYMEQSLASRLININPYQVQTFMGTLKITPWTDTWRDTAVSDPLIVYDTSAYDFARQSYNENGERIDWRGTQTDWQGLSVDQQAGLETVISAGHAWPYPKGQFLDKNGNLINGTGVPKKNQFILVPPGFANSGQLVRYLGGIGQAQEGFNNTVTQTGEKFQTGIKSTIQDAGFSAPVSMGSRIIDTRSAEYIRTNEVTFEGKCFLPNSRLFAYFDDVDVSKYCVPDVNYGERLESPGSMVRGPYSSITGTFKTNVLEIKGDKTSDDLDQHKKQDGTQNTSNGQQDRGTTIADITYELLSTNTLTELDFVGTKLTGKVKVLQNEESTDIYVYGKRVPTNSYYLVGIGSKFERELIDDAESATGRNSVLVVAGLKGQYQVSKAGVLSDNVALLTPAFVRTGQKTQYVNSPSTFRIDITPTGNIDGSNKVFTIVHNSTNETPVSGSEFVVVSSNLYTNSPSSFITLEEAAGTVNGTNKTFTIAKAPISGTHEVYIDNTLKTLTTHYTLDATGKTITFFDAPATGTKVKVSYVHASVTPINGTTYPIYKLSGNTITFPQAPAANTLLKVSYAVSNATDDNDWRSAADLLEVLQKLYISKFVDVAIPTTILDLAPYATVAGNQSKVEVYNTKYKPLNITNKSIKGIGFVPANPTTTTASLLLEFEDSVKFGDTSIDATFELKIKKAATDKDLTQPALTLKCDSTGTIKGKFIIPDPKVDGNPKFRTGDRVFRLTNSSTNEELPTVSRADAKYSATGWIDTKQEQQYSTKQFKVSEEYVEGERTPVTLQDTFNSAGNVAPRDPLAQSWTVSEPTGIFLTAVDVFFYSKDPTLPVILQIRPVDDGGNPSIKLMHEVVLDSADVIVNKIDLKAQTVTVLGRSASDSGGILGFNKGAWGPAAPYDTTKTDIYRVMSANQLSGKNTNTIQHGVAFPFTTANGVAAPCDDMIPTRFVLDHPVYLPGNNSNYCFVLLTDSIQAPGTGIETLEQTYQVYMAQTGAAPITQFNNTPNATPVHLLKPLEQGEDDYNYILGTQTRLNTIPGSDGVLFKSINGISWESDQKADLKYKLYRASFNTNQNAEIQFINEKLTLSALISDPFETAAGETEIRVYHRNHNIPAGGYVRFVGLPTGGEINGIPYQVLMRTEGHVIQNPTLDSYIINVGVAATESGKVGGRSVLASGNIRFEEFLLRTNPIVLPDTTLTWTFDGTTSKAAYDPESVPWETISDLPFTDNVDVIMPKSAMFCSVINEELKLTDASRSPGARNSVKITAYMSSKSDFISPVLDSERIGIDTKGVRLDNPVGTGTESNNINNSKFDTLQILPTTNTPLVSTLVNKIYFSDTDNKLTGSDFNYLGKKVTGVGSLFTSELKIGDTIRHPILDSSRTIVDIVSDTEMYIDEEFPLSQIANSSNAGGTSTLFYNPPFLRLKTGDASVAAHLSSLDVGKYLTVEGASTNNRNFVNKKILGVNYTPTSTLIDTDLSQAHGTPTICLCEIIVEHRLPESAAELTPAQRLECNALSASTFKITQLNNFIDEIAPEGGSCASKYVSRVMNITQAANCLKVKFDGCRPPHANIDVYYKIGSQTDDVTFAKKNWTKMEYSIETNGVLEYTTPTENSTSSSFSAYEANALRIQPFTMAQVKIVLRGGHTPLYPKIKNLSIIAVEE
jgi:hypothetical protein